MKTQHVLITVATLIFLSCNSAPEATENMATPTTTTVAPKDTVINHFERKEEAQMARDTTPVADTTRVKVP